MYYYTKKRTTRRRTPSNKCATEAIVSGNTGATAAMNDGTTTGRRPRQQRRRRRLHGALGNRRHGNTAAVNKLAVGRLGRRATAADAEARARRGRRPRLRRNRHLQLLLLAAAEAHAAACWCHGGEKLFLTLPARADNCPSTGATISRRRPSTRYPPTALNRIARSPTLCVRFIFISFSLSTSYGLTRDADAAEFFSGPIFEIII